MRIAPPGRTSSSQTGFVKPCGPHHRARCVGSVHIWKTRVRGASKVRVRTSSRAGDVAADSLLAAMFLPFPLKFAEVLIEAIETLVPESAIVLDPIGHVLERARLQPTRPPLRFATARDETG